MTHAPSRSLPTRVLLTGASRGIGAAIARALATQGVRLALVGRDRSALEAVVGLDSHVFLTADLERDAEVELLADRAAEALGGLDGFVASAGVVEYAPIGAISSQSLGRQMRVNFEAPFVLAQRAGQHIARAGGGAMLLIASTLGLVPAPLTAAYSASKAALISMTRAFARELGPQGVRVNAVAPGVVDTDMVRVVRPSSLDDDAAAGEGAGARIAAQLDALRGLHALGRLGTPEDVAETAMYLLGARYVTGAVVVVDGGLLLGLGKP